MEHRAKILPVIIMLATSFLACNWEGTTPTESDIESPSPVPVSTELTSELPE